MAVYVDEPMKIIGGKFDGGCHMCADSIDELKAFAIKLGLQEKWFQPKSWPHFDLTASKRKLAIAMGAQVVTGYQMIKILRTTYGGPVVNP